jgi:glycosyltransferase involved in cell wall biosynthesis
VRTNYISSQSRGDCSGGWSGLSFNLYEKLAGHARLGVNYIGPVYPGASRLDRVVSKLWRITGCGGRFFFFSEERLRRIEKQLRASLPPGDYNLFLGATPWVRFHPEKPYGAYLDACFRTYFDNNLKTEEFSVEDIRRIELAEKDWLERARHVFWASAWSRDEAIRHYQLSKDNHHVVGIGGNLEVPEADTYSGGLLFLFIAQNFALKGGPAACAALQGVRRSQPDAKLVVLGEKPPVEFLQQPGVEYAGFLRKDRPEELARFRSILASAFCLVHPTNSDMVPQVIIECGCFGCPAIAPSRFAIPELVLNRQTGVLIDTPFTAADFEREMLWMIENQAAYEDMRRKARAHLISGFTFQAVAERVASRIKSEGMNP